MSNPNMCHLPIQLRFKVDFWPINHRHVITDKNCIFYISLIFQKSNPVGAKFTVLALEPIGRTYNPYGKPSLGFIGPFKVMSGHQEGQQHRKKYLCPEIKAMSKKVWRAVQPCKCVLGIFPEVPDG